MAVGTVLMTRAVSVSSAILAMIELIYAQYEASVAQLREAVEAAASGR